MSIELDGIIDWIANNWVWPAAIVGVIIVFFIVISLLPDAKIATSDKFPTDGDEARALAVGAIQTTTSFGAWNDPEAQNISGSKSLRRNLVEMWDLTSRDSWLETIRELPERRTDPLRDGLLSLRAELADSLGHRPSKREWVEAAKGQGASGREITKVIGDIVTIETSMKKKKLGTVVLPDAATIRHTRGYAYGQCIALATWGVALGFATREEIRPLIKQISDRAREDFGSWEEFGRSYLLGRTLRLTEQGMEPEKAIEKTDDGLVAYGRAFDVKRGGGPWSTLRW